MLKPNTLLTTAILSIVFPFIADAQLKDSILYRDDKAQWLRCARSGNFDSALYYIKQCQNIADSEISNSPNTAFLHISQAITYEAMNDIRMACFEVNKCVNQFEQNVLPTDTSSLAKNLYSEALWQFVEVNQTAANFTGAAPGLVKYYQLLTQRRDTFALVKAELQLGQQYLHFGQYSKALLVYDSLERRLNAPMNKLIAGYVTPFSVYNPLAQLYQETGNPEKALEYIKKVNNYCCNGAKLQAADFLGLRDFAPTVTALADCYRSLQFYDSARQVLMPLAKQIGNNKLLGEACAGLLQEEASVDLDEKKYTAAEGKLKQSLAILDTLQDRSDYYGPVLLNLASIYQFTGRYAAADSLLRKEIKDEYALGLQASYNMQQASLALCRNLLYQNNMAEATDSLLAAGKRTLHLVNANFAGMPESDQVKYAAAFDDIFNMLYTVLANNPHIGSEIKQMAFTLQLQRKNQVLNNQAASLERLRQNSDTGFANLYAAWLANRQMLAKQYSLPAPNRFLNADSLEHICEQLERQGVGSAVSGLALHTARLINNPGEALIDFVRYVVITKNNTAKKNMYGAFILAGGDSTPVFITLCGEEALMRLITDSEGQPLSNEQIAQKLYTQGAPGAVRLYKYIWQPLQNYLHGIKMVNYSTAGLLSNISFNAICTGNDILANNVTLRCYSSLVNVANNNIDSLPVAMNIWGNMDYSDLLNNAAYNNTYNTLIPANNGVDIKPGNQLKKMSKSPLENFNTDEVTDIQYIFKKAGINCSSFERNAATEENFKALAPQTSGILHISTHGFYTPYNKKDADAQLPGSFIAGNTNPLFRCGLAFAGVNYYWMKGQPKPNHDDGILTGYEVSQLDLHKVQLVTLSACETGLGDITATEGNLGLQRAFKLAGVQKLLVSLWQVPAKQTQQLLIKFYTYWLAGSTPAQALQKAETDMQKAHYPPYYWAGFVLVE